MKFGAKRSAGVWECFGHLWQVLVIDRTDANDCSRWVDDAFTACSLAEGPDLAEQILSLSLRYNFTLDQGKFVASQIAKYVGIIFNSVNMTLSIPWIKRMAALDLIRLLLSLTCWTPFQLKSLLGTLFHFTSILSQCRGYLSRLLACMKGLRGPLSPDDWLCADLLMWEAILLNWSGSSLVSVRAARGLGLPPALRFAFDASPTFGLGIVCFTTGDWISIQLSPAQLEAAFVEKAHSSTVLEAFAMLCILIHFPDLVRGLAFRANTDARNLECSVHRGYSTKPHADEILRTFAALQCNLDCLMSVHQVPRRRNQLADALSTNDVPKFKRLARERQLFVKDSPAIPRSLPLWLSPTSPFSA
jgi:hypothetical protein